MPHVRERDPNPDEVPADTTTSTAPATDRDTSSGPDQTSDADVETDAAVLDPEPGA
ncbi:MAG TPA: hypothetical protein VFQ75_06365 [Candidatus Limnocylindrales bacterium]|jgi:hypothetical protein|nr:hypothetical protein [Candidatus Limnocylindrales bacterium]